MKNPTFWHGSPSGELVGSPSGLHIGSRQAATEALEARIGIPADGRGWDGTREYGKTLLAGKRTLERLYGGWRQTGANSGVGEEDYYPSGKMCYSDRTPVALNSRPSVFEVELAGEMSNTPEKPMEDFKANGIMAGQIRRGTARRGYFYKNISEDEGSVSAVVPGRSHLLVCQVERKARAR